MNAQPWLDDGEGAMSAVFAQTLPALTGNGAPPLPEMFAPWHHAAMTPLKQASIMEIRRHARRLATFACALGRLIGLAEQEIQTLRIGSLLHDIGKAAVPPQVIFKCGRLTPEEWAAMKYHPIIGDLLCARVAGLGKVRPIVRHHHERLDGSGYPDGLRGDEVPLLAQIVGVVDVYDALISHRPYKKAFDRDHAFRILTREAQAGWRRIDLVEGLMDVADGEGEWLSAVAAV